MGLTTTLRWQVFDLSGKWLRKTLMSFVQITYGRTISRQIRDTLSWCFSESQLLYYATTLREAGWPGGRRAPPPPPRSQHDMERTRQVGRRCGGGGASWLLGLLLAGEWILSSLECVRVLQDIQFKLNCPNYFDHKMGVIRIKFDL